MSWRLRRIRRPGKDLPDFEHVYTSPALQSVLEQLDEMGNDPQGSKGEAFGRRIEREKRKRAEAAGEEIVRHPALTGGE